MPIDFKLNPYIPKSKTAYIFPESNIFTISSYFGGIYMKHSLSSWQKIGFIFTSISGVLFHFLFDWTGGSILVAPFSAVNESIWEHMKLLFFPMFVFSLIESRYIGKEYKNFWCAKLVGISIGIALIPVLYYTVKGIFGASPDWFNITIFFIAAAVSYFIETKLLSKDLIKCQSPATALLVLWLLAFTFVLLTFFPPHIPLFKDPLTRTYGYFG